MTHPFWPCPHEAELKTLLAAGQWPAAAPAELRSHVASCRSCNATALLTLGFRAERASAVQSAQLPPPGLLWWRAQLRRRNAALERINRPLIGAQILACAAILVAASIFLLVFGSDAAHWLASLQPQTAQAGHLPTFLSSDAAAQWLNFPWSYLLPGVALLILAGGLALYLASERS